jgi:anaerobic dimethyl sulfoxide reductase subunit B (iron-sulfur subunit)
VSHTAETHGHTGDHRTDRGDHRTDRFAIDLARCTGCQTCSIACKDRAGLPDDLDWLRVEVHEGGSYPAPTLFYRVVHCFHCAEPPCIDACPTGAMARQENGWVHVEEGLCVACGSCIEACPFAAIVMRPEGVASKCDGCADEVARGWQPTCVRACPMRALGYGPPQNVPTVNRTRDDHFSDHGIGPSVLYLRR